MARSVDYLSGALYVTFFGLDEDEFSFDDLFGNVKYSLKARYPSLDECERWDGRETKVFLENSLVEFGISEYCGLVSISVRAKDDYKGLGEHFINNAWMNILKTMKDNTYHSNYSHMATFSNGEAVYSLA